MNKNDINETGRYFSVSLRFKNFQQFKSQRIVSYSGNSHNGFTLIEMLISTVTLALISGFIFQMFLVSSNANLKAQNIDKASCVAVNFIESIKSQKSYNDIQNISFLDGLPFNCDDVYYFWYDMDWEMIDKTNGLTASGIYDMIYPQNAVYAARLSIARNEKISETGSFVDIGVECYDLFHPTGSMVLLNYDASKYFIE